MSSRQEGPTAAYTSAYTHTYHIISAYPLGYLGDLYPAEYTHKQPPYSVRDTIYEPSVHIAR